MQGTRMSSSLGDRSAPLLGEFERGQMEVQETTSRTLPRP